MLRRFLFFAALALLAAPLSLTLFPGTASAHEVQAVTINGTNYLMEIGSLNMPVVVDDKSGATLTVKLPDPSDPTNLDAPGAQPVTGLDKTMKVELSAQGKTMTMDLMPSHDEPGSYEAVYYPTVQTDLSYRFFGTIDGTPVDFTTTCSEDEMQPKPADTTPVTLSSGVTRTLDAGAYGCPVSKVDLGFPEMSSSVQQLMQSSNMDMGDSTARGLSAAALVVGLLALGAGVAAWRRSRKGMR